jgi:hypothetical protein
MGRLLTPLQVERRQRRIFLAWSTRVCLTLFVSLVLLLHLLEPDFDPIETTMSEYALSSHGELMIAAFIVLSLGIFCLAAGLLLVSNKEREARIPFTLLASAAVSIFLAGAFVVDPPAAGRSLSGTIHDAASMLGFTTLIIAMALWTRRMERIPGWRGYAPISARLTFLAAILFLAFLLSGTFAGGLVQRAFVATILAWQLHVSRVVLT